MKKSQPAVIQETPWHSGKVVRRIELNDRGVPSIKDWNFAKKHGYMITTREPTCNGVRYYNGRGEWK